jgi:hypothetical protein
VGAGSSQEAEFRLLGDIPAGQWRLVADGIIVYPVDVTFELIYRRPSGDTAIGTWNQHFDPRPAGFDAQAYEVTVDAPAFTWADGDQLIFRYTGNNTQPNQPMAYIPNGDGELANGRIPFIDLP